MDFTEFFEHEDIGRYQLTSPSNPFFSSRLENSTIPITKIGHKCITVTDVRNFISYLKHGYILHWKYFSCEHDQRLNKNAEFD